MNQQEQKTRKRGVDGARRLRQGLTLDGAAEVGRQDIPEGLVSLAAHSVSSSKPLAGWRQGVNSQICLVD